jgi:hypothetical protein
LSLLHTEKFQGEVLKPLTSSRRNTEKKNPIHFFALGVRQRFPTLTPDDISEVMAHPHELLRTGFLSALNLVVPCHRPDLSKVILKCVDPDDDNSEAVRRLHRAMQQNSDFAAAILRVRTPDEILPAREFVKLISFLESQNEFDLVKFANRGMKALIRSQE